MNKLFSHSQVGYITEITEAININATEDFAKLQFDLDHDLSAIPVESDAGIVGIIEKDAIFEEHKSLLDFLVSHTLKDHLNENILIVDARENVEHALKKLMKGETLQKNCAVYHLGKFYGVLNSEKLINHIFDLRAHELQKAEEIQKEMTGSGHIDNDKIFIDVKIKMAHAVGGDFYRVTELANGKYMVLCFDVSGKDVSASLITGLLTGYFASIEGLQHKLKLSSLEVIEGLHTLIEKSTPLGYFVAASFLFVDTLREVYEVYNMGYGPLYSIAKKSNQQKISIHQPQFQPLGFPGLKIDSSKVLRGKIESGLSFFGFSDGLSDAQNCHGKTFGDERIDKLVYKNCDSENSLFISKILKSVEEFVGTTPAADDITLFYVTLY